VVNNKNEFMEQYFGVIEILKVENIFPADAHDQGDKNVMLMDHVRFVHYPDCQQLILWLPDYFKEYNDVNIRNKEDNIIIFDHKIEDIISGSIQILIDSLFIYPGVYELNVKKKDGMVHTVIFKKYPEGEMPKIAQSKVPEAINLDSEPIVYRDGFGNILPNEDLLLRQNIIDKTINKFTRRLEYVSHGREGEVIYIEGEKSIRFLMEPGAYDCIFYLNIPSMANWEKTTNFPLSEREDIISFVAKETQRDQASSCDFNISENEIAYYKK
jgi:hypothetical protein